MTDGVWQIQQSIYSKLEEWKSIQQSEKTIDNIKMTKNLEKQANV